MLVKEIPEQSLDDSQIAGGNAGNGSWSGKVTWADLNGETEIKKEPVKFMVSKDVIEIPEMFKHVTENMLWPCQNKPFACTMEEFWSSKGVHKDFKKIVDLN